MNKHEMKALRTYREVNSAPCTHDFDHPIGHKTNPNALPKVLSTFVTSRMDDRQTIIIGKTMYVLSKPLQMSPHNFIRLIVATDSVTQSHRNTARHKS
jgi:hypothetical protein